MLFKNKNINAATKYIYHKKNVYTNNFLELNKTDFQSLIGNKLNIFN